MNIPATDTIFDIGNWFLQKANDEGWFLEYEKLNHLLFLSQIYYAKSNQNNILFPAVFVCDKKGFCDPNFNYIIDYFRANKKTIILPSEISKFLDSIWNKYAEYSIKELNTLIKNTSSYIDNYIPGTTNIVDINEIVGKFYNPTQTIQTTNKHKDKKLLISQNGPVIVSKWQPRKLTTTPKR